jgi:hypothetical protein
VLIPLQHEWRRRPGQRRTSPNAAGPSGQGARIAKDAGKFNAAMPPAPFGRIFMAAPTTDIAVEHDFHRELR